MSVEVCEHGHVARKCDVCELEERASEKSDLIQELTQACCNKNVEIAKLKAEVARLRSVCREAAFALTELHGQMEPGSRMRSHTMGVIADLEQAGKEATDGQ